MAKKYRASKTGKVFSTREEAIKDNARYISDADYRFTVKSDNLKGTKNFSIPFIESKRRTLTNAGLATGAIISENMLDTIAKYAKAASLPIKTAIGLAVKESTLGNPTDDSSVYKILNAKNREVFKNAGRGQWLNTQGNAVKAAQLINFYKDSFNPYDEAIMYSLKKAGYDKPGNVYDYKDYINYLEQGEKYADKKAKIYSKKYGDKNVLEAGFRFYKEHPDQYNPGQSNYPQLVDKRGEEVWGSPEIQNWYKTYRKRSLEEGGK